jgi:hypothetical protein
VRRCGGPSLCELTDERMGGLTMGANTFFGYFCQSLVIAREVQHHVPRQLVLHSFRLSADFFGAFPPKLGISPGSSHHGESLPLGFAENL